MDPITSDDQLPNEPTLGDEITAVLREGVLRVAAHRAFDALKDRRLHHKERAVLAVVLEAMNGNTGTAWPSREMIAENLGLEVKSVKNALYELRKLGYLDWAKQTAEGQTRRLTHYYAPIVKHDREQLQREIASAVQALRSGKSAPDTGQKIDTKSAPPAGQKSAPPVGHAPPAGQKSAPPVGQKSALPAGQQETTKELTKEKRRVCPNTGSDLALDLGPEEPPKPASKPKPKTVIKYTLAFENFWLAYPDRTNNSKFKAFQEWKKLSSDDRASALQSLSNYQAFLKSKPDTPCVHAERYLKWRRFDGFLESKKPTGKQAWWQNPEELAKATPERWRKGIKKHANGIWPVKELGPPPSSPGCVAPKDIIAELGLTDFYDARGRKR